jgi:signal transduction histidine kinase
MTIRWPRPTARLRLALMYTALFVVTGTALLGVSYLLVQHRERGPATAARIICQASVTGKNGVAASGVIAGAPSNSPVLSPADCTGVVGAFYYRSSSSGASNSGPSGSGPSGSGVSGSGSGSSGGAVADLGPGQLSAVPGPTAAAIRQLTAAVAASQSHTLDSFRIASAIALGLISILSFALSWWVAGRVLRPVHAITEAARRLSEQTLHRRINLQGPDDELKELADTFDAMLGRLDRAFRSQQRFVANASHELRTPLATERVLIDEALANRFAQPQDFRAILEQLRTNSEETERLVDALLVLARSERGLDRWSEVDLAATAQGALDAAALEAELKGVELRCDLSPVTVKGDPGLLDRLVGNVVENGIRHNFAGGWVEITTGRSGTRAFLQVTNTGPVLDEATVATLTEPFRRAGPDRSAHDGGFGLGLSIVSGVVDAHLGSMVLRPRPGGGLVVQVQLPAAARPVSSPDKEHGLAQRS